MVNYLVANTNDEKTSSTLVPCTKKQPCSIYSCRVVKLAIRNKVFTDHVMLYCVCDL